VLLHHECLAEASGCIRSRSWQTVLIENQGISCDNYCYVPGTFTGSTTYAASEYVFEDNFIGVEFVVRDYGRMRLASNVWAQDIFVLPDSVLELGPYSLIVDSSEHDIGGGLVSNSGLGGRIIWAGTPAGTFLLFQ